MKTIAAILLLATVAPASVHRAPREAARETLPGRSVAQLSQPPAPILVTPAPAPAPTPPEAPLAVVPGQDEAAYDNLLAREPGMRAEVGGFESFLKGEKLLGVLPTWQLTRTASDYEKCAGPAFQVAPIAEWQHIAATLRFIKAHVEPVIGDVEAMSGYRNPDLNECAGGARESAHRRFFALDLVPVRAIARTGLIRSICAIHGFRGAGYDIGLGFYSGLRFHLDSKGYRKWGPNGKGATSPCITGV